MTRSTNTATSIGFDSTYEGLKPRIKSHVYYRSATGFDSTYEGLKLRRWNDPTTDSQRFRQYL